MSRGDTLLLPTAHQHNVYEDEIPHEVPLHTAESDPAPSTRRRGRRCALTAVGVTGVLVLAVVATVLVTVDDMRRKLPSLALDNDNASTLQAHVALSPYGTAVNASATTKPLSSYHSISVDDASCVVTVRGRTPSQTEPLARSGHFARVSFDLDSATLPSGRTAQLAIRANLSLTDPAWARSVVAQTRSGRPAPPLGIDCHSTVTIHIFDLLPISIPVSIQRHLNASTLFHLGEGGGSNGMPQTRAQDWIFDSSSNNSPRVSNHSGSTVTSTVVPTTSIDSDDTNTPTPHTNTNTTTTSDRPPLIHNASTFTMTVNITEQLTAVTHRAALMVAGYCRNLTVYVPAAAYAIHVAPSSPSPHDGAFNTTTSTHPHTNGTYARGDDVVDGTLPPHHTVAMGGLKLNVNTTTTSPPSHHGNGTNTRSDDNLHDTSRGPNNVTVVVGGFTLDLVEGTVTETLVSVTNLSLTVPWLVVDVVEELMSTSDNTMSIAFVPVNQSQLLRAAMANRALHVQALPVTTSGSRHETDGNSSMHRQDVDTDTHPTSSSFSSTGDDGTTSLYLSIALVPDDVDNSPDFDLVLNVTSDTGDKGTAQVDGHLIVVDTVHAVLETNIMWELNGTDPEGVHSVGMTHGMVRAQGLEYRVNRLAATWTGDVTGKRGVQGQVDVNVSQWMLDAAVVETLTDGLGTMSTSNVFGNHGHNRPLLDGTSRFALSSLVVHAPNINPGRTIKASLTATGAFMGTQSGELDAAFAMESPENLPGLYRSSFNMSVLASPSAWAAGHVSTNPHHHHAHHAGANAIEILSVTLPRANVRVSHGGAIGSFDAFGRIITTPDSLDDDGNAGMTYILQSLGTNWSLLSSASSVSAVLDVAQLPHDGDWTPVVLTHAAFDLLEMGEGKAQLTANGDATVSGNDHYSLNVMGNRRTNAVHGPEDFPFTYQGTATVEGDGDEQLALVTLTSLGWSVYDTQGAVACAGSVETNSGFSADLSKLSVVWQVPSMSDLTLSSQHRRDSGIALASSPVSVQLDVDVSTFNSVMASDFDGTYSTTVTLYGDDVAMQTTLTCLLPDDSFNLKANARYPVSKSGRTVTGNMEVSVSDESQFALTVGSLTWNVATNPAAFSLACTGCSANVVGETFSVDTMSILYREGFASVLVSVSDASERVFDLTLPQINWNFASLQALSMQSLVTASTSQGSVSCQGCTVQCAGHGFTLDTMSIMWDEGTASVQVSLSAINDPVKLFVLSLPQISWHIPSEATSLSMSTSTLTSSQGSVACQGCSVQVTDQTYTLDDMSCTWNDGGASVSIALSASNDDTSAQESEQLFALTLPSINWNTKSSSQGSVTCEQCSVNVAGQLYSFDAMSCMWADETASVSLSVSTPNDAVVTSVVPPAQPASLALTRAGYTSLFSLDIPQMSWSVAGDKGHVDMQDARVDIPTEGVAYNVDTLSMDWSIGDLSTNHPLDVDVSLAVSQQGLRRVALPGYPAPLDNMDTVQDGPVIQGKASVTLSKTATKLSGQGQLGDASDDAMGAFEAIVAYTSAPESPRQGSVTSGRVTVTQGIDEVALITITVNDLEWNLDDRSGFITADVKGVLQDASQGTVQTRTGWVVDSTSNWQVSEVLQYDIDGVQGRTFDVTLSTSPESGENHNQLTHHH
eukprot:m.170388 g.170388  ORF g.170388 m.170388 type:complete len:1647 (+) comp13236_c0_seq1:180-5120(+)